MAGILDRLTKLIAPRVCDYCEGGSGLAFVPSLRAMVRCPSCGGSGDPNESTAETTALLHLRVMAKTAKATAKPRSVA